MGKFTRHLKDFLRKARKDVIKGFEDPADASKVQTVAGYASSVAAAVACITALQAAPLFVPALLLAGCAAAGAALAPSQGIGRIAGFLLGPILIPHVALAGAGMAAGMLCDLALKALAAPFRAARAAVKDKSVTFDVTFAPKALPAPAEPEFNLAALNRVPAKDVVRVTVNPPRPE